MTDKDFLNFAWHSLTSGQQDIITVKYHISKNNHKTINELQKEIEKLELNEKFIRSGTRIRIMKKYEIPIIINKINYETNQT